MRPGLRFPPTVLDDSELEVPITTKTNKNQIWMLMEWSKVNEMNLDLTWTPKNLQSSNYLFQGLPRRFYTLKLSSKSLIWLDEYKLAPEIVNSLWQCAAGLLKGGVASKYPYH